MAITCGKKARKGGGGNRYAIKKSWKRANRAAYRLADSARQKQHDDFERGKIGKAKGGAA